MLLKTYYSNNFKEENLAAVILKIRSKLGFQKDPKIGKCSIPSQIVQKWPKIEYKHNANHFNKEFGT